MKPLIVFLLAITTSCCILLCSAQGDRGGDGGRGGGFGYGYGGASAGSGAYAGYGSNGQPGGYVGYGTYSGYNGQPGAPGAPGAPPGGYGYGYGYRNGYNDYGYYRNNAPAKALPKRRIICFIVPTLWILRTFKM